MVFETEFYLTGLFFILFLTITTIFGFILIFILHKKVIDLPFLEIFVISLGCGIIFYVFYSYIIDTFLFFNIFTILLPLIIFDFGGLVFIFKSESRIKQKLAFINIRQILINNKSEIIIFLLFFIVIFYFQIQIQYGKIVRYESLFAKDPFYWCRMVMYLLDYGHLEYSEVGFYSAGYIFINAGMNLFYPNFHFIYFFYKFVPIFYMSLIIIIGYFISKILFNQIFLRFLTMIGFLTLYFFNYRFLMSLPSVPATILFFIFSFAFIDPKIPFYYKGILLSGAIIFHPLYGAMSIVIYFIYIIQHFFVLIIKKKKGKKVVYTFLKESLYNLLIVFGLLIPLLINLTLNHPFWFQRYWNTLFPAKIFVFKLSTNLYVKDFPILHLGNFSPEEFNYILYYLVNHIWYNNKWIFFILLYFLFIIKKKNYKKFGDFINIMKISILFSLLFYFMPYLIEWFFPLMILDKLNSFLYLFRLRILEFSAGFIVLMFVFTVHDIFLLLSMITSKLKNKFPKYKKFLNGKNLRTSKKKKNQLIKSTLKIESILIIFSLWFTYNLFQNNEFAYNHTYHDDEFVEMILDIGDSEIPDINIKATILLPVIEDKIILSLLYRYNYEFIEFNQSYPELIDLIITKNASYIILPIEEISEETIRNFVFSYSIFFEYSKYMVIKIK